MHAHLGLLILTLSASSVQGGGHEPSDQLLAAARAQIGMRNLDSAAALLRRVATAPVRETSDRVQAWVLLGIVQFYTLGDSGATAAFREALVLDPALQVSELQELDSILAGIFAAERAAVAAAGAAPPVAPAPLVYDCVIKCPEGVEPPRFSFFPRLELGNPDVSVRDRRMRTYLVFHGVVGADGVLDRVSIVWAGGTARGMEAQVRLGLAQARFTPGRAAAGVPVSTRVALRFDFEAEGTGWVRYRYRVVAR